MVTKHWKIIKGVLEIDSAIYSVSAGGSVYYNLNGVLDTTGESVGQIVAYAFYNKNHIEKCFGAFANNDKLFNWPSKNISQTVVNVAGVLQPDNAESTAHTNKSGGCYKFVFGTGDAVANADDYCLVQPIESGITVHNISVAQNSYDTESGNYVTYVMCNGVATQSITIAEVGIVKAIYTKFVEQVDGGSTDAANYRNILAIREVLTEPLKLIEGEGFTVTIKVEV